MGLIRYYSSSVFMWTFNVTARALASVPQVFLAKRTVFVYTYANGVRMEALSWHKNEFPRISSFMAQRK